MADLFKHDNVTSHSISVVEANKEFFDKANASAQGHGESFFDRLLKIPQVREIYDDLINGVVQSYPFDANKTRLLDFACGNGEVSLRLSPHCKSVTGIDISQGSIDSFKKKIQISNVSNIEVVCDELKPDALNGAKFDVIICLQAYHHMEDCLQITNLLKSFLAPGGALLVVDLLKGTQHMPAVVVEIASTMQEMIHNSPHSHHMMPYADGFSKDEMHGFFIGAGLTNFEFAEAVTRKREDKIYTLFLAKGVNV